MAFDVAPILNHLERRCALRYARRVIPRYTPPEMTRIWSDEHKIRCWLRVELAVCEAMASRDLVPRDEVAILAALASTVDCDRLSRRALEIEETTKHDVIAFLAAFEELAGPPARHVHFGLTSSDVLDTALALRLVEATNVILADLEAFLTAMRALVEVHRRTVMVGRSHGIHAEPTTFGLVMAGYYAETHRNWARLRAARDEIAVGKLSGAVGTMAHLPLEIETEALTSLGLVPEPVATQVVARDRHAHYFSALATTAAGLERLAIELRHLQRTEVREAEEPFSVGQKGSSAMPHKRNPIMTENVTGLARLIRAWAQAAQENVALWHERDISHSSVERVIAPDATAALSFMIRRMQRVVAGLVVYPERMRENLSITRGMVFSQAVLLTLVQRGVARQEAYEIVQRCAMRVWDEGIDLRSALVADAALNARLSPSDLDALFDVEYPLRSVDALIDRALQPVAH